MISFEKQDKWNNKVDVKYEQFCFASIILFLSITLLNLFQIEYHLKANFTRVTKSVVENNSKRTILIY